MFFIDEVAAGGLLHEASARKPNNLILSDLFYCAAHDTFTLTPTHLPAKSSLMLYSCTSGTPPVKNVCVNKCMWYTEFT